MNERVQLTGEIVNRLTDSVIFKCKGHELRVHKSTIINEGPEVHGEVTLTVPRWFAAGHKLV